MALTISSTLSLLVNGVYRFLLPVFSTRDRMYFLSLAIERLLSRLLLSNISTNFVLLCIFMDGVRNRLRARRRKVHFSSCRYKKRDIPFPSLFLKTSRGDAVQPWPLCGHASTTPFLLFAKRGALISKARFLVSPSSETGTL